MRRRKRQPEDIRFDRVLWLSELLPVLFAIFSMLETNGAVNRFPSNRFLLQGAGALVSDSKLREVLVVEDEWLVRMELAEAFAALGFIVFESASAEHAAEILRAKPDLTLLVTDIRLAGLRNGWELAIEARQTSPGLPVIYLSANPLAPDLIVEGGVFIDKPALMDKVTRTARELLGEAY